MKISLSRRNALILLVIIGVLAVIAAYPAITGNISQKTENKKVLLETNFGNITIELFSDMPITAGNFESLVRQHFYDGTIFHRVIKNFMIQGGDPEGTGRGGPGYAIKDEFNPKYSNVRGTIAMANAGPNTGGSQFFINVVNNTYLDGRHPVFGRVVSGMDVVDRISNVPTDQNDRPIEEVKLLRARVVE